MTGWIILGVYLAGWIIAARKIAVYMINDAGKITAVDAEDRILGRLLGFVIGLAWPILLLAALVTGKLPKTDRELRDEATVRDARIADLERENERLRTRAGG